MGIKIGTNRKASSNMVIFAIACFIFAFAFISIGIGLPINYVSKHFQTKSIVKNGEPINGIVLEYREGSIINNVQKYYIVYEYELDGQKKVGETGSIYNLETAGNMTTIKLYLYKGQVRAADDLGDKEVYLSFVAIAPLGFGIMCFVFGIKFVKGIKNSSRKPIAGGTITTATYIDSYSNTRINRVRYYKIRCKFTNLNGQAVEEYAQGLFSPHEKTYLKAKGNFQISYLGNRVVIIENLDGIEISIFDNKPTISLDENAGDIIKENVEHFQCERCGQIVKPNSDGFCPLCGELIDMKIKTGTQQNQIKCPKCNNSVSNSAKFCNHCGTSMAQQVNNESAQLEVCPSCGKQVSSSAKFCNYCGNKMR